MSEQQIPIVQVHEIDADEFEVHVVRYAMRDGVSVDQDAETLTGFATRHAAQTTADFIWRSICDAHGIGRREGMA